MDLLIQLLSVLGAILILGAYYAQQRGAWSIGDARYLWANLVGAGLLTIVAVWDRRLGFVVLEGAWAIISLISIARLSRRGAGPGS